MVDPKLCPSCGASNAPDAARCWLCNFEFSGDAQVASQDAAGTPPQFAPAAERTAFSFSLGTLLLVMTLVAVVFGMLAVAPGLGIVLAILALPVLARTAGVVRAREAKGLPTPPGKRILLFVGSLFTSLVIAVVVGIASIGTFCGVCLGIYSASVPGRFDENTAMLVAIPAAIATTVGAIVLAVKWVKARWRRDTRKP